MPTRIAPGMYQVSPVEGIAFVVNAVGTGFAVSAALDTTLLDITAGTRVPITPQMMSGIGSSHEIRIRVIFTQESTATAAYTIDVSGEDEAELDAFTINIDASRPLPYQTLVELNVVVRA